MAEPQIWVEKYFFPIINIEGNKDHNPEEDVNPTLDLDAVAAKVPLTRPVYQLALDATIGEHETADNPPYSGQLQIIGIFRVDQSLSEEKAEELLKSYGISFLYSAIREMVMTLTSRGPWPQIFLPIIDQDDIDMEIVDISSEIVEQEEELE